MSTRKREAALAGRELEAADRVAELRRGAPPLGMAFRQS
jgi:hypothetical protein